MSECITEVRREAGPRGPIVEASQRLVVWLDRKTDTHKLSVELSERLLTHTQHRDHPLPQKLRMRGGRAARPNRAGGSQPEIGGVVRQKDRYTQVEC